MTTDKALIVVDVQRDFCEGGALAVPNTLSLLVPLDTYIDATRARGILIVFTKDWHPPKHGSFDTHAGRWPVHCVEHSSGAELMPPLNARQTDLVIHKGIDAGTEGYSGFQATHLMEELQRAGVNQVAICGIATEYCVQATAMDAVQGGLTTHVLTDLIREIDPAAAAQARNTMHSAGIFLSTSAAWP